MANDSCLPIALEIRDENTADSTFEQVPFHSVPPFNGTSVKQSPLTISERGLYKYKHWPLKLNQFFNRYRLSIPPYLHSKCSIVSYLFQSVDSLV